MLKGSLRLAGLALVLAALLPACLRPEEQPEPRFQSAAEQGPGPAASAAALQQEVARLRQDLDARDAGQAMTSVAHADLARRLDELATLNAELSERLKTAGQNVEQLAVERKNLTEALATARTRLEILDGEHTDPAPGAPPAQPIRAAAEKDHAEHALASEPAD